jgi:hypothetical protein
VSHLSHSQGPGVHISTEQEGQREIERERGMEGERERERGETLKVHILDILRFSYRQHKVRSDQWSLQETTSGVQIS